MGKLVAPLFVLLIFIGVCFGDDISLNPETWPQGTIEKYTKLLNGLHVDKPQGFSKNGEGIVSGTSSALAVHVATDALSKGLNAMDAVLAAIMAQIVISSGSYVSFAGILGLVYYNAKDGKIYSLNGNWNKPLQFKPDTCTNFDTNCIGKKVLIPGFMSALESARKRFGTVNLSTLLEPSIYFAEKGFVLDTLLSSYFNSKSLQSKLFRTKEGYEIFINPQTNQPYRYGELFKQVKLSQMLRNVSKYGIDYMYRGDWAEKFVNTVNEYGGSVSLNDLAQYEPIWSDPIKVTYRSDNISIHSLGLPADGGVRVGETMNLLELLNVNNSYTQSASTLSKLMDIAKWSQLLKSVVYFDPKSLNKMFPNIDLSFSGRTSKETAKQVFDIMFNNPPQDLQNRWYGFYKNCTTKEGNTCIYEDKKIPKKLNPFEGHSDAFTVIDKYGNVAAIVHSINSMPFGTGLFVDGIALSDATTANLGQLKITENGKQIPSPIQPTIVTLNEKPIIASGTIGGGLHPSTILNLYNILNQRLTPKLACDLPRFQGIQYTSNGCLPKNTTIPMGGDQFSEEIIKQVKSTQCLNILNEILEPTSTGSPGYSSLVYAYYGMDGRKMYLGGVNKEFNGFTEGI
ncbi:hypothetical protein ABK040_014438 [Willaertia magna]